MGATGRMNAISLGFLSALLSAACLAVLAASDPKRLGGHRSALSSLRLPAIAVTVVPGALLLVAGLGVAFLIWLGTTPVLGWAITMAFSAYASRQGSGPESTSEAPER